MLFTRRQSAVTRGGSHMKDNRTILVVGDKPASRELVEAVLLGQGYNLAYADGDAAALLSSGHVNPDLVLLMLGIPEVVKTCHRLRADPRGCRSG
jgi:CheY-like chemotaxis protein